MIVAVRSGASLALVGATMFTSCTSCSAAIDDLEPRCPSCGADRTVELQIGAFLGPAIARTRRWLLVLAGVHALDGIYVMSQRSAFTPRLLSYIAFAKLGLAAAHVLLWLWAKRQPLPALAIAFGLFILMTVAVVVLVSPAYVVSLGWVITFIILTFGLGAARDAHTMRAKAREVSSQ